jgi:hypothetical protein
MTSSGEEVKEMEKLTAKAVAQEIGIPAKKLRSFLRSEVKENGGVVGVDTPGSGKTYSFEESEVEEIKARYEAWAAKKSEKKAASVEGETE